MTNDLHVESVKDEAEDEQYEKELEANHKVEVGEEELEKLEG